MPLQNNAYAKQHGSFSERLKLPNSDEEIFSGYEEDVSFIRECFTAWVKADVEAILECRGIKPCTSYSRTNDYVKLWLRHCVQL